MNQTGGRSGAMTPVTLDIKFHVQLADKSH